MESTALDTLPLAIFYTYFSPYTGHAIEIDGILYPTLEHAYQCLRYRDAKIIKEIQKATSAIKAWETSTRYKTVQIPEYKSDEYKLKIMMKLMKAKTEQHADVRQALLDSGDLKIVKHIVSGPPGDGFWDDGENGEGANHIGRMWMEIRQGLRERASPPSSAA